MRWCAVVIRRRQQSRTEETEEIMGTDVYCARCEGRRPSNEGVRTLYDNVYDAGGNAGAQDNRRRTRDSAADIIVTRQQLYKSFPVGSSRRARIIARYRKVHVVAAVSRYMVSLLPSLCGT